MLTPVADLLMAKRRRAFVRLIEARFKELGLSRADVVRLADMTPAQGEQWFYGPTDDPPFAGIVRLCVLLEISSEEIFAAVIEEEKAKNPYYPMAGPAFGKVQASLLKLEAGRAARVSRLLAAEAAAEARSDERRKRRAPEDPPEPAK